MKTANIFKTAFSKPVTAGKVALWVAMVILYPITLMVLGLNLLLAIVGFIGPIFSNKDARPSNDFGSTDDDWPTEHEVSSNPGAYPFERSYYGE